MAIVVANEPNPELIGANAYEAGKAPAVRENIVETRRLAQQNAQFQQGQAADAAQFNAKVIAAQQQNAQATAADLYKEQMQQAGYAALNEQKKAEAELDRQHRTEMAEASQRLQREKEFNDSVAAGLKDGSLYYAPQQKQQLAQLDQAIAQVYGDESIEPDQQEEMAARLHQKRRAIIPMVRPENERPVPIEQEMANNTVVLTEDGRQVPLGQLGRMPKVGEMLGTITTRNGNKQYNWDPVKPATKEEKPAVDLADKAWSDPGKSLQMEGVVRSQLQADLDVAYKNELADWKMKKAAHDAAEKAKAASDDGKFTPEPFKEPPPRLQLPTQQQVGQELWRRSGGRTGIMPPEEQLSLLQRSIGSMTGPAREAAQKVLEMFVVESTPKQPTSILEDQDAPVKITDDEAGDEAYRKLKSGKKYIHPDGTVRTKQ